MPSRSRKRNKGKERKAKQQAKTVDNAINVMYTLWSGSLHSCATVIVPDVDHPVSKFMNEFYLRTVMDKDFGQCLLRDAFDTYPQVFQNESYRETLMDILIGLSTNMLILITEPGPDHTEEQTVNTALNIAAIILVLEEYGKTNDFDSALVGRTTTSKRRHLSMKVNSNLRDILKFYRKRIACKCLKRMHLDSRKSTPKKMSRCFNCNVEKERASLSVCSRCMITEYCSRECQVANWDKHMRDCDEYNRAEGHTIIDGILF